MGHKRKRKATVYRDHAGEWRFRVKAGNGVEIGAAEEGFAQKRTALNRVEQGWPDAVVTVIT